MRQHPLFDLPPGIESPTSSHGPEDDLPPRLVALREVLGWEGFLRLLRHYGGIKIYVPRTVTATHPLAQALGLETALALCRYVDSGIFDVPTGRNVYRALRDQEIRTDHAHGVSIRMLALRFGLSERRVCRVLATAPPRPPGQ